jgi:hypothetical protein
VNERGDLLLHHADHARMAVADRGHRDARTEVEVTLSVLVPNLAATAARQLQLEAGVRGIT